MKALDSLGKRACDGLFPLPAEENAMFKHLLKALESLGERACDGLFSLPVEENTIFEPLLKAWENLLTSVLAMAFSPCLSKKRQSPSPS